MEQRYSLEFARRHQPLPTYPFLIETPERIVRSSIGFHLRCLLSEMDLPEGEQKDFCETVSQHYEQALSLFQRERLQRKKGDPHATLFYHNESHAVLQVGHDAVTAARQILRVPVLESKISDEGITALILGMFYHDTGYVDNVSKGENYAARTPVHVEKSIHVATREIERIGVPASLDPQKVKDLAQRVIYHTHFPFTKDKQDTFTRSLTLLPDEKTQVEARLLGRVGQLIDLGGQCARIDSFPRGVSLLRDELNSTDYDSQKGTELIGSDETLLPNYASFIQNVVIPEVGQTAKDLFGDDEEHNPYTKQWNSIVCLENRRVNTQHF